MKDLSADDYRVVLQSRLDIRMRFEIFDRDDTYINDITGNVVTGSGNIDAESDIRRTASISVIPDYKSKLVIDEQGIIWVDKYVVIYLGIIDMRTGNIREWKFGKFWFTNTNTTYDATNNQITINCSDMMSVLDGSKNGELGQLTISFPAYEEDEEGHPLHYNTIRNAVITTISQLGRINDYQIDDIGEYNAMPRYNDDYRAYRVSTVVEIPEYPYQQALWNTIPFDQTFSAGTTVLNIITTFRDLYPNYEAYFNEDGTFCMNMVPSGEEDPIVIDNDFLQKIVVSENTSIDMTAVRNISHVWGQVLEADYFTEDANCISLNDNTYVVTLDGYEDKYMNGDTIALKLFDVKTIANYYSSNVTFDYDTYKVIIENYGDELKAGDKISFKMPASGGKYIKINNFLSFPIYNVNTNTEYDTTALEKNKEYVFEIQKLNDSWIGYYVGTRQTTTEGLYLNVNNFGKIPIYDENTETFLDTSQLVPGGIYVFKIKGKYVNNQNEYKAYWLGEWQVQGIVALVDNYLGDDALFVSSVPKAEEKYIEGFFDPSTGKIYGDRIFNEDTNKYEYNNPYTGIINMLYYQPDIDAYYRCVRRYSKAYFESIYACPSVRLRVIPDSPFTCQRIGEVMDVMTDEKNITSNSLAVSRADWEIYKQARLTDSITLTTTLCPFADVNIKVSYQRHDLDKPEPYIVKSISHDFSQGNGTTTWQLMRFYPLYER